MSVCTKPSPSFLEALVTSDSVITAKSRSLATQAVQLCCTLKCSQWVLKDDGAQSKTIADPVWNAHITGGILRSL